MQSHIGEVGISLSVYDDEKWDFEGIFQVGRIGLDLSGTIDLYVSTSVSC